MRWRASATHGYVPASGASMLVRNTRGYVALWLRSSLEFIPCPRIVLELAMRDVECLPAPCCVLGRDGVSQRAAVCLSRATEDEITRALQYCRQCTQLATLQSGSEHGGDAVGRQEQAPRLSRPPRRRAAAPASSAEESKSCRCQQTRQRRRDAPQRLGAGWRRLRVRGRTPRFWACILATEATKWCQWCC